VTVHNTGFTGPISAWTIKWTFPDGQTINQLWSGVLSQSGSAVSVKNASWNGSLAPNTSTTFGFTGSWNGANGVPSPVTCIPS
jgi:endo-1,4-beta-xylanase